MKKLTASLIAAGLVTGMSAPVMAEGITGNVSIVSDYVWRGVTQSDKKMAVQGGLDYEKDAFSAGIWGSSLGTTTTGSEIDVYGSYNFGPVAVGAIYYYYPHQAASANSTEVNVGGDVGPVSLMASYNLDLKGTYAEAGYEMEVSKGVNLGLHIGYNMPNGGANKVDYSVGFSTTAGGVDLGASYAYGEADAGNEGKFFLSVGKSL
jgi:uncharacterized protein (TIGR02001 family)